MNKHLLALGLFCCCFITFSFAQKIIKTETVDAIKDINNPKKEKLLIDYIKYNDTCFQKSIYIVKGKCREIISYKSNDFTTLHGRYCSYTADGYIDTTGLFLNGLKEGYWYRMMADSQYQVELYEHGLLKEITDTFNSKLSDTEGRYDDTDPYTATFNGGAKAIQKYLVKHLDGIGDYNSGHDIVAFTVDKTGSVTDVYMWLTKDNYSDNFAKKVIAGMPRWNPAKDKLTGLPKIMDMRQPIKWISF